MCLCGWRERERLATMEQQFGGSGVTGCALFSDVLAQDCGLKTGGRRCVGIIRSGSPHTLPVGDRKRPLQLFTGLAFVMKGKEGRRFPERGRQQILAVDPAKAVTACVCADLEFKGLITYVDMFVSSPLGGNHCGYARLTCARLHSQLDYAPIPNCFCLLEEIWLETPARPLSSHRERGAINPVQNAEKGFFSFVFVCFEIQSRPGWNVVLHRPDLKLNYATDLCFFFRGWGFSFSICCRELFFYIYYCHQATDSNYHIFRTIGTPKIL